MTIRDGMTDKLRRMTAATERQNRALEVTDTLSDQVAANANFDRMTDAINRAADAVEQFNQRQEEAAKKGNKVKDVWSGV